MAEASDESVQLLIRCALQSFEDLPVSCPSSWTVLQLKEKLAVDCPSKPEVKRQRLIYAGHCLHDEHSLKSVFELRPIDDGNVHVIHLVSPPKNISAFGAPPPMLRRRNVNQTQRTTTSTATATQAMNQNFNNVLPFYANSLWASSAAATAAQGGFVAPPSPHVAAMSASTNAQFQSAYQAYMISYTNYMYQMMSGLGNNPYGVQVSPPILLNNQQPAMPNLQQQPQQVNQPQRAFAAEANLAAAPAAGGIVQEAVAGDVDGPQRDFLDVIYKAIRMCFLIMLVYVYSSAERFFGVLVFILVVWFVQARRDRNIRERADRELAAAVDNVRQQQQANINQTGEDAANNTNEAAAGATTRANIEEPREPTAWVVFWSTCYTFITSFFSSLIPDNPVPVNIN